MLNENYCCSAIVVVNVVVINVSLGVSIQIINKIIIAFRLTLEKEKVMKREESE